MNLTISSSKTIKIMETKIFKSNISKFYSSRKKKDNIYFHVNQQIVFDNRVTSSSLRVFLSIWANKNGYPLKQKSLAVELNMNPSTFNRHLSKLSEFGYVYKCVYSDANNASFSDKKYNYFFCDVGRAEDYYHILLAFGIIDEKATIRKNINRFSLSDFEEFETRKDRINLKQVNKWAEDYLLRQKSKVDLDGIDFILEQINVLNNEFYNISNLPNKSLHFQDFLKEEIKLTKANARYNLTKDKVEKNIDDLISKYLSSSSVN